MEDVRIIQMEETEHQSKSKGAWEKSQATDSRRGELAEEITLGRGNKEKEIVS